MGSARSNPVMLRCGMDGGWREFHGTDHDAEAIVELPAFAQYDRGVCCRRSLWIWCGNVAHASVVDDVRFPSRPQR